MAAVVIKATQPALAAIKLAWWRERLEELDQGKVPAEPRLRAAADELLPRGLSGSALAQLESGWAVLMQDQQDQQDQAVAEERGSRLFELGAELLGIPFDEDIRTAGHLFAKGDLGRRGLVKLSAQEIGGGKAFGRQARPLTALAALAVRDLKQGGPPFEPEATPGRAWTLLRHRLTGRL